MGNSVSPTMTPCLSNKGSPKLHGFYSSSADAKNSQRTEMVLRFHRRDGNQTITSTEFMAIQGGANSANWNEMKNGETMERYGTWKVNPQGQLEISLQEGHDPFQPVQQATVVAHETPEVAPRDCATSCNPTGKARSSGDFEAERNSTVDNTQLSDWAVAVPYIKMVGCITRHPPAQYDEGIRGVQMLGAGKSGTTGKAQTFDHYLVLKLEKGHLKDKVNGSQVDQVVLPWCTSTVDQGCSLM